MKRIQIRDMGAGMDLVNARNRIPGDKCRSVLNFHPRRTMLERRLGCLRFKDFYKAPYHFFPVAAIEYKGKIVVATAKIDESTSSGVFYLKNNADFSWSWEAVARTIAGISYASNTGNYLHGKHLDWDLSIYDGRVYATNGTHEPIIFDDKGWRLWGVRPPRHEPIAIDSPAFNPHESTTDASRNSFDGKIYLFEPATQTFVERVSGADFHRVTLYEVQAEYGGAVSGQYFAAMPNPPRRQDYSYRTTFLTKTHESNPSDMTNHVSAGIPGRIDIYDIAFRDRALLVIRGFSNGNIHCKFSPVYEEHAGDADNSVWIYDMGKYHEIRNVKMLSPVEEFHFNPDPPINADDQWLEVEDEDKFYVGQKLNVWTPGIPPNFHYTRTAGSDSTRQFTVTDKGISTGGYPYVKIDRLVSSSSNEMTLITKPEDTRNISSITNLGGNKIRIKMTADHDFVDDDRITITGTPGYNDVIEAAIEPSPALPDPPGAPGSDEIDIYHQWVVPAGLGTILRIYKDKYFVSWRSGYIYDPSRSIPVSLNNHQIAIKLPDGSFHLAKIYLFGVTVNTQKAYFYPPADLPDGYYAIYKDERFWLTEALPVDKSSGTTPEDLPKELDGYYVDGDGKEQKYGETIRVIKFRLNPFTKQPMADVSNYLEENLCGNIYLYEKDQASVADPRNITGINIYRNSGTLENPWVWNRNASNKGDIPILRARAKDKGLYLEQDRDFMKVCKYHVFDRTGRAFTWGNPTEREVLYYSKTSEPESFPVTNFFRFDHEVMAVMPSPDATVAYSSLTIAYVFTAQELWAIREDTSSGQLGITRISQRHGIGNRRAVCTAGELIYFINRMGVFALAGTEPKRVSDDVQKYFTGQYPLDHRVIDSARIFYDHVENNVLCTLSIGDEDSLAFANATETTWEFSPALFDYILSFNLERKEWYCYRYMLENKYAAFEGMLRTSDGQLWGWYNRADDNIINHGGLFLMHYSCYDDCRITNQTGMDYYDREEGRGDDYDYYDYYDYDYDEYGEYGEYGDDYDGGYY